MPSTTSTSSVRRLALRTAAGAVTLAFLAAGPGAVAAGAQDANVADQASPAQTEDDVIYTTPASIDAEIEEYTTTSAPASTTTTAAEDAIDRDAIAGSEGPSAAMGALSGRYRSLSANLVAMWADSADMSLDSFLETNAEGLSGLLGDTTSGQRITQLAGQVGSTGDADMFRARFSDAGIGIDWDSVATLDDLGGQLNLHAQNLDAKVINAGSNFARNLGSLRAPELTAPTLDGALATSVPREGLVFGLFLDRSLAALVADHPDVLGQVSQSGLGSQALTDAWRSSIVSAGNDISVDLRDKMPNRCLAVMMDVMAAGDTSGATGDCSPCAAGGLYLNNALESLFNPQANALRPQAGDGFLPTNEINNMDPWLRDSVFSSNPGLSGSVAAAQDGSATGQCAGAGAATRSTLKTTLPGVFSKLGRGS